MYGSSPRNFVETHSNGILAVVFDAIKYSMAALYWSHLREDRPNDFATRYSQQNAVKQ